MIAGNHATIATEAGWPRWRLAVVALALLILPSCRTMAVEHQLAAPRGDDNTIEADSATEQTAEFDSDANENDDADTTNLASATSALEPAGDTGPLARTACGVATVPIPTAVTCAPWAPPGIARPWPHDEYICDGGDQDILANLGPDGQIRGIELEDTIVNGETIDGRTMIEASNRVCLYAPRFAAVRRVEGALEGAQHDQLVAVAQPLLPHVGNEEAIPTIAVQPLQPIGGVAIKHPSVARLRQAAERAIADVPIRGLSAGFAPHEDLLAIREGIYSQLEKARLIESVDAAIVWTHDKALQVVLDSQEAHVETGVQKAQATFRVDVPNNPRLRVIKVASTCSAKPGEVVDFTIRFDNIGDQRIENVTLIDNLTTRLEYVPDSSQSSRKGKFSTEANEGDSLILRWDFAEPLPARDGGIVRFQCRVR